jgi:cob(I)alamin adenosyltransferase
MRIYTRTGDSGETGLFGGGRVSKANLRVEACGTVDELNALLGWAETLVRPLSLTEALQTVQGELLVIGADLATPLDASAAATARTRRVTAEHSARLESWIDNLETATTPLTTFILPGGSPAAAALHVCRTVCRRAERRVVALAAAERVNSQVIVYLNRLSDVLFTLARWVNAREGVPEPSWNGSPARERRSDR